MPSPEEEEFLLGVSPPGYFYQFSQYEIHQHSKDEIEFTLETRVNVCNQKDMKLFLSDLNESNHYTFNIQSGKPDRSSESIPYKVVGTEFPQQTLGIDTLSISMHCSSHTIA